MLAHRKRRRRKPGAEARYSNLGYLALGEVVAAAAGESYEDTVRRNLLEPLGMTSTDFRYTDTSAGRQRPATSCAAARSRRPSA
jgi:CubicO group peptidase (beta-lactamase class C family)